MFLRLYAFLDKTYIILLIINALLFVIKVYAIDTINV